MTTQLVFVWPFVPSLQSVIMLPLDGGISILAPPPDWHYLASHAASFILDISHLPFPFVIGLLSRCISATCCRPRYPETPRQALCIKLRASDAGCGYLDKRTAAPACGSADLSLPTL